MSSPTTKEGTTSHLPFKTQCSIYTAVQSQHQAGYLNTTDVDGVPLLTLALLNFETFSTLRMRLIRQLLECGANVNQAYQRDLGAHHDERHRYREVTPWQDLIAGAVIDSRWETHPCYDLIMSNWVELAVSFIAHGAKSEIDLKDKSIECIRRGFWRWNPGKARELESIIFEQASNVPKSTNIKNFKFTGIFSRKGNR